MEEPIFEEIFLKNIRSILCTKCDNQFEINMEDVEAICDECGECIQTNLGDFSQEEFVWHPKRNF